MGRAERPRWETLFAWQGRYISSVHILERPANSNDLAHAAICDQIVQTPFVQPQSFRFVTRLPNEVI
jgi:hypothetical protein